MCVCGPVIDNIITEVSATTATTTTTTTTTTIATTPTSITTSDKRLPASTQVPTGSTFFVVQLKPGKPNYAHQRPTRPTSKPHPAGRTRHHHTHHHTQKVFKTLLYTCKKKKMSSPTPPIPSPLKPTLINSYAI